MTHLFEAEYSHGGTGHYDGNGDSEDGMEESRVKHEGNRKWLTCLKQSMVMAAQATMAAWPTVKTPWRTLSRVEHVGNRK